MLELKKGFESVNKTFRIPVHIVDQLEQLAGNYNTSVNKIVSVVLAGGDYKEVAATDEGIAALVGELVADHTIG